MGVFYAKLIAGGLGWFMGGPVGALLGLAVGHWFDQALAANLHSSTASRAGDIAQAFLHASFMLLGRVAKADGRVDEHEIDHAEALMRHLRLTAAARREAIQLFKRGAAADFDLAKTVADFRARSQGNSRLAMALLQFLVGLAVADGRVHAAELDVLRDIAAALGIPQSELEHLVAMTMAQSQFEFQDDDDRPRHDPELAAAYRALGVSADAGDNEVKRAYRRLMRENHPDKLMAQGLPEQLVKQATRRSQQISAAYETIKTQRAG